MKRALIALGHHILRDIYRVLSTGETYHDVGAEAVISFSSKKKEQTMIRLLERAGYTVTRAAAA